jgi:hypothetical protein
MREADQSPPSSAEAKEWVELYLHSPNMSSWRGAQCKIKAQGQIYLYLYFTFSRFTRPGKLNSIMNGSKSIIHGILEQFVSIRW